jgi:hypothetical protein
MLSNGEGLNPLEPAAAAQALDELHDGHLVSISLVDGALELGCESFSGERVHIRMNSLYRMRADRFLQGNIINDVRLHSLSDRDVREFRRAVTVTDDEEVPAEWFAREFAEAQRERWQMLVLESSYGCDLVAVSKDSAGLMVLKGQVVR